MNAVMTIHATFLDAMQKCKELRKAVDAFSHLGESKLFVEDAPYNLSLFYMCRLVDRYVDAFQSLRKVFPRTDVDVLPIVDYLAYKTTFEDFVMVADSLSGVLSRIDEHAEQGGFKLISDESLEYLKPYDLQERFGWQHPLDKYIQGIENITWLFNKQSKITSDLVGFLEKEAQKEINFLDNVSLEDYVVKEFKLFASREIEDSPLKLRNIAIKFKGNRLVKLARTHWAELYELDERLVDKIIDEVPVSPEEYSRLYDESEWQELVGNRDILRILRDTSDPEELYDWEMLFKRDLLFYNRINETNVMFLFARIHRANLIKSELYDGLKAKYETYLFGRVVSAKPVVEPNPAQEHVNFMPNRQSIPEQEELQEPDLKESVSNYIHPLVDEDYLISCIKEYTDGPDRNPDFNKNCLWYSIYTVLSQRHPLLGNKPILLRKSRAKFEKWVDIKIHPKMYPCFKHSLDTVPPYFRKPKNYPWSLEAYRKAKGQKVSTYEGYARVADYFQKNVFNVLDIFLKQ